mmetsp:Transcript_10829/g.22645  ORF Transcript_10829/g.22645 Transcript_10829/m.22645 type:complete len:351 (+) Transcript_10829:145-1197(+)
MPCPLLPRRHRRRHRHRRVIFVRKARPDFCWQDRHHHHHYLLLLVLLHHRIHRSFPLPLRPEEPPFQFPRQPRRGLPAATTAAIRTTTTTTTTAPSSTTTSRRSTSTGSLRKSRDERNKEKGMNRMATTWSTNWWILSSNAWELRRTRRKRGGGPNTAFAMATATTTTATATTRTRTDVVRTKAIERAPAPAPVRPFLRRRITHRNSAKTTLPTPPSRPSILPPPSSPPSPARPPSWKNNPLPASTKRGENPTTSFALTSRPISIPWHRPSDWPNCGRWGFTTNTRRKKTKTTTMSKKQTKTKTKTTTKIHEANESSTDRCPPTSYCPAEPIPTSNDSSRCTNTSFPFDR